MHKALIQSLNSSIYNGKVYTKLKTAKSQRTIYLAELAKADPGPADQTRAPCFEIPESATG